MSRTYTTPEGIVVSDTIEGAIQARKDMYTADELEYLDDLMDTACEAEERWGPDYLERISCGSECPMCHGPSPVLGFLGNRTHYRCRNCGMEFSSETESEPDLPYIQSPYSR